MMSRFDEFETNCAQRNCMNCRYHSDESLILITVLRHPSAAQYVCDDCVSRGTERFGWTKVTEEELILLLVHNE